MYSIYTIPTSYVQLLYLAIQIIMFSLVTDSQSWPTIPHLHVGRLGPPCTTGVTQGAGSQSQIVHVTPSLQALSKHF